MTRQRGAITRATAANTAFELGMARALAEAAEGVTLPPPAPRPEGPRRRRRTVRPRWERQAVAVIDAPSDHDAALHVEPPTAEQVGTATRAAAAYTLRRVAEDEQGAALRELLEMMGVVDPPAPPPEAPTRRGPVDEPHPAGECAFCDDVSRYRDAGFTPRDLVEAIGPTAAAVERRLWRHGQHALATAVHQEAKR